MQLDPTDPVVALCGQGMQAEGEGRAADAASLFQQACGNRDLARQYYEAARDTVGVLGDDPHGQMLHDGIRRALDRVPAAS